MADKDKMTMLDKFTMLILGKETRRFFQPGLLGLLLIKQISFVCSTVCVQYLQERRFDVILLSYLIFNGSGNKKGRIIIQIRNFYTRNNKTERRCFYEFSFFVL